MFNKKLLGERIKKVRGKKSQDVFANEVGISRGALSYYENGERQPDSEIIYKICELCNVSADYLLGFTDNSTTDENLQAVCDYTGLSEDAVNSIKRFKDAFLSLEGKEIDKDSYLRLLKMHDVYNWLLSNNYISEIASELEVVLYSSEKTENNYDIENNTICDLARYRLIKLMESLSNHFDQREQVKENGEHNPSEE